MIDNNKCSLVKIPDEIMVMPASKEWALKINDYLNSSFIERDSTIFFIIGEYVKGKFVPFDDEGHTQDSLLEAYHKILISGVSGDLALYVAQDVDLDNIYLN